MQFDFNRVWAYGLIAALLVLAAIANNYHRHLNLPRDCDEPGYLEMAQAMRQGNFFGDPVQRDFLPGLSAHLADNGFEVKDYMWLFTPLAYHLEPHTGIVINQYPPGTGLFLSIFPKEHRQMLFPGMVALIMLLLPLLALYLVFPKDAATRWKGAWWLLVVLVVFMLLWPYRKEFTRVSSVGMTYGLLVAAGIALRKRPAWALAFIGLAANFRIAHFVLVGPVGLYLIWDQLIQSGEWKRIPAWIRTGVVGIGSVLVGGGLWYILYAWRLMGNPFWPTYGGMDVNFAESSGFWDNVAFYGWEDNAWMVATILGLVFLGYTARKGWYSVSAFWFVAGLAIFNYIFFFTHAVKVDYYPHAGAVIVVGALVEALAAAPKGIRLPSWSKLAFPLVAVVVIVMGVMRTTPGTHATNQRSQTAELEQCFGEYDLVWNNLYSGTVEYALQKPGMTLLWATPEVQVQSITWLYEQGYSQIFWLDDLPVEESRITQRLDKAEIPYYKASCTTVGPVLIIEP